MSDQSQNSETHLSEMVATFKNQCKVSWENSRKAMKALLNAVHKQYKDVKKFASEEGQDVYNKVTQADHELVSALQNVYQGMKETIRNDYDQIMKVTAESWTEMEQQVESFKTTMTEAFDIVADKTSTTYKDAMAALKNYHGKTATEFQQFYNDMIAFLEKMYKESVAKLAVASDQTCLD